MVNLFDFTANEFSERFRSSCYSAKRFAECFLEVTGVRETEATVAGSSEIRNKNSPYDLNFPVTVPTEISSPANTISVGRRQNRGTTPESFSNSPVHECDNSENVPFQVRDKINDDNAEEIYAPVNFSKKTAKKRSASTVSPPVPSKLKKVSVESSTEEEKESSPDSEFLEDIKKYTVPGLHKVLATSLAAPRPEYTLRELDVCHVQVLKNELLSRPLTQCGKPIVVIAKGLKDVDKFDEKDLDSYGLEVIGGNHRREAINEIIKTSTSNETKELFKFVYVQIYTEMEPFEALRLAQIHNNTDKVHHELNTKEKIILCKHMLTTSFSGQKSLDWRKACSRIVGEDVPKMETILFLSALPDVIYDMVLKVIEKYSRLEIKGQKASKKTLKAGLKATVDCPSYNFKCLRGDLTKDEIISLLNGVLEGKSTLVELKLESSRIKEVKEVQRQFITCTGSANWEEVAKRFSEWVEEDKLQAFRGQERGKRMSDALKGYIARALKWEEEEKTVEGFRSQESANELHVHSSNGKRMSIFLFPIDVQRMNNSSLVKETSKFVGSPLIFLDLPKDWNEETLERFFRNVRSMNIRNSIDVFHIIVFPCRKGVMSFLEMVPKVATSSGLKVELAYTHYTKKSQISQDAHNLVEEIFPFALCHCGERKVNRQVSNIFMFPSEKAQRDLDVGAKYSREKPVGLYKALLSLYGHPNCWILDLCSGAGSAAAACAENGCFHCIVAEKDPEKLRMIRRRLAKEGKEGDR